MSSTRRAKDGEQTRQEKYMSSSVFVRGLMGNIIARRCEVLDDADERELVWFLQLVSHREGGIKAVAAELLKRFPERVATTNMQRLGIKRGKVCPAALVRQIRGDFPERYPGQQLYPLRGEDAEFDLADLTGDPSDEISARLRARSEALPENYPSDDFFSRCDWAASQEFDALLERLCLDPEAKVASPWYFPTLIETLREYQVAWVAERNAGLVSTEIGRQVNETLDYALETGRMVLVDGMARTGKTTAARQWCEQRPGRARYVQVPSSTDDGGFFRAIAKALGVSINLNSKAVELRDRVEDTLQRSRLAVVFDEAHYLWPQGNFRDALPTRLNWLMTALVNHGVPVALVTTPQFIRSQQRVEQKSCWTSEQFIGRVCLYHPLPDTLDEKDLAAVARVQLPEGDAKATALLVAYARSSAKYLAGIDSVVTRARYLAGKAGRAKVTCADVAAAIQEGVIPSDNALSAALADGAGGKGGSRRRTAAAAPLQAPCKPVAEPLPAAPRRSHDFAEVESTRRAAPVSPSRVRFGEPVPA